MRKVLAAMGTDSGQVSGGDGHSVQWQTKFRRRCGRVLHILNEQLRAACHLIIWDLLLFLESLWWKMGSPGWHLCSPLFKCQVQSKTPFYPWCLFLPEEDKEPWPLTPLWGLGTWEYLLGKECTEFSEHGFWCPVISIVWGRRAVFLPQGHSETIEEGSW